MVRSMTDSSNCEYICESLASQEESTTMSSNPPSSLDTINEIVEWFG
jgi:hypothetical protein